jgi:hypothetical protein
MKKLLLLIVLTSSVNFAQTLDTIRKIEIIYGYGAQCFPRDGIYAKSERFIFEKSAEGSFELTKYHKFWNISKNNATIFSKDSSVTNVNKKCNSTVLIDLLRNLSIDNQNFSYAFLKQKINKPTIHRIKKLAKEINRFFIVECEGIFDCEFRNEVIDSIQKFNRFDEFILSLNLTSNQLFTIGYYDNARITITSQSNSTSYDFSFVNNSLGQPIIKYYNNNYMNDYSYVNLIANEKIRELIPKNTITYKAFDFEKITDSYIRWYLEH